MHAVRALTVCNNAGDRLVKDSTLQGSTHPIRPLFGVAIGKGKAQGPVADAADELVNDVVQQDVAHVLRAHAARLRAGHPHKTEAARGAGWVQAVLTTGLTCKSACLATPRPASAPRTLQLLGAGDAVHGTAAAFVRASAATEPLHPWLVFEAKARLRGAYMVPRRLARPP